MRKFNSFVTGKVSSVKPLHFKGDGHGTFISIHEPEWPLAEIQKEWTKNEYAKAIRDAFNWYTLTQDEKLGENLAIASLAATGHRPELAEAVKNSSLSLGHTTAWLLRMMHAGLIIRYRDARFVAKAIRKCVNNPKTASESKAPRLNIQDYITARIKNVKAEIDSAFDMVLSNSPSAKTDVRINEILKEFPIPSNRMSDVINYAQNHATELALAASGDDDDLAEAYDYMSDESIEKAIIFWDDVINVLTSIAGQKTVVVRKPRAKKVLPPSKIVSKLKFTKDFQELSLKSIDPTVILKSSELWVYNVANRKLGRYVAKDGQTFSVKSTRLENIDETKSFQKTLRKPAEQLKEFGKLSPGRAIKWFAAIRAVDTPLRDAINADSILLKAGK